MRFRAEQHLRRAVEIRAVREQGRRVECRTFTMWWKRRPQNEASSAAPTESAATAPGTLPPARVCVIASGSAVGNAVRRNRAKRQLREMFRQHQDVVPHDCDLLLIARRAIVECPAQELATRFSEACRRIKAELQ